MEKQKETYEAPEIEVIEFELEDDIAASGDNFGATVSCIEGVF